MAGIPEFWIPGEITAYHVISRTALSGYPLENVEKDFFVELVKKLGMLYFAEIICFCCIGNHFHLLARMRPDADFSDSDVLKRLEAFYGEDRIFGEGQLPYFREKLSSLSEFVREIKVGFARF